MEKTLKTLQGNEGFTLVEVLVSAAIFAIGFLAIAQLQMTAIHGNRTARGTTEALSLMQSKIDSLRLLPINHPDLDDNNGGILGEPNDVTLTTDIGDPGAAHADPRVTAYGNVYQVFWNVAEDQPVAGLRTVRVIVAWSEGNDRRVFTDIVRSSVF